MSKQHRLYLEFKMILHENKTQRVGWKYSQVYQSLMSIDVHVTLFEVRLCVPVKSVERQISQLENSV